MEFGQEGCQSGNKSVQVLSNTVLSVSPQFLPPAAYSSQDQLKTGLWNTTVPTATDVQKDQIAFSDLFLRLF